MNPLCTCELGGCKVPKHQPEPSLVGCLLWTLVGVAVAVLLVALWSTSSRAEGVDDRRTTVDSAVTDQVDSWVCPTRTRSCLAKSEERIHPLALTTAAELRADLARWGVTEYRERIVLMTIGHVSNESRWQAVPVCGAPTECVTECAEQAGNGAPGPASGDVRGLSTFCATRTECRAVSRCLAECAAAHGYKGKALRDVKRCNDGGGSAGFAQLKVEGQLVKAYEDAHPGEVVDYYDRAQSVRVLAWNLVRAHGRCARGLTCDGRHSMVSWESACPAVTGWDRWPVALHRIGKGGLLGKDVAGAWIHNCTMSRYVRNVAVFAARR